jgi:glycosyltransferase involved in cell wall biosynthesis
MLTPTVSCIVPAFNAERYLREALDSIFAQTHPALDVLVVDDGSTDDSPGVAKSYGDRVRYLFQPNAGPAAARNRGLDAARGQFVAFLDADDLWHPEQLARQLARFAARPELDYCVTHAQNFWVPELKEEEALYRDHPRSRPVAGYVTSTILAKLALFHTVGRFNPELPHADDTDWFLRADAKGAVKELLLEVLLFRRMHPGNRSRTRGSASRADYLRLLKATLDRRRRETT